MTFDERKQEGLKYIREDNYKKALEIFSILYYERPSDEDILKTVLFLFDRITEANYDFIPISGEEFILRGVARFYKTEIKNSIDDFNSAIKLNPNLDYAFKCKAFSLTYQGNYFLAIEELKKAIELKPHGEYYDDIAENLSRAGLKQEAIEYHEKAIKADPENARLWYNYGTHLGQMGMIANAVIKFQKAIELFPDYRDAKHNLAYYYKMLTNI